MIELNQTNLINDVRKRIHKIQDILRTHDLGVGVFPATGAPRMNGWLRYLTNAELWAGKAYVVITPDEADPLVLYASNYEAAWGQMTATTDRIQTLPTDEDPIAQLSELLQNHLDHKQRIGIVNRDVNFTYGEWVQLTSSLPQASFVDITDAANALRVIKSPFEVEVMRNLGRICSNALDQFEAHLRPGMRAWEAGAVAEAHIRSQGGFRGWTKFSMDGRPFSMPTPLDRRLTTDDIFTFEIDYSGPYGYWCELSCVFSFQDLPPQVRHRLETTELAITESAKAALPGAPHGIVGEISDRVFQEAGYTVIGAHTRHCHSIGTDDLDLRIPMPPDAPLAENMVLSYHPASLLADQLGFLISDNFVVTPEGALPLSNRGRAYRRINL